MRCYSEYGCRGIMKCFCPDCGGYYYSSAIGKRDGYWSTNYSKDYMYDTFRELQIEEPTVMDINWCYLTPESSWEESDYDFQNDYETFDILHLVKSERTPQPEDAFYREKGTFVRGKNFYKYAHRLFKYENSSECVYCGSHNIVCSNMKASTADFLKMEYTMQVKRPQLEQEAKEYTEGLLPTQMMNLPPVKSSAMIEKAYLQHLVQTESDIMFFTKQLANLLETYWKTTIPYFDRFLSPRLTGPEKLQQKPEPPKLKPVLIAFWGKKAHENEEAMKKYKKRRKEVWRLQDEYEEDRFNIRKRSLPERQMLTKALSEGNLYFIPEKQVADVQCATMIYKEICECKKHLQTLINMRDNLHAMGVVHPKYWDFPAITMLLEYLEVGRCDRLAGTNGAYNLYESESRSNAILCKLDQIIVSLDQIKTNQYRIYKLLSNIEGSVSVLSGAMNDMVSTVQVSEQKLASIENSAKVNAYYSKKNAYYAQIAAAETSTLAFLSTYDHL